MTDVSMLVLGRRVPQTLKAQGTWLGEETTLSINILELGAIQVFLELWNFSKCEIS